MSFFSKFLLFLVGFAVFAAACAWIMGGESEKNSTRISIAASPANVFPYLVEGKKIEKWATGVQISGTYAVDENGDSKVLQRIVNRDGKETVWSDSVMRFDSGSDGEDGTDGEGRSDGRAISIQSRKGGLSKTMVFQLEENSIGGTDLLYRVIQSASGLEQFMFALTKKESKTQMVTEMTKLKKLIESEVEPSPIKEDEPAEGGVPLDEDSANDNNGNMKSGSAETPVAEKATAQSTGTSVVDQVLGPVYKKSNVKPKDGERNFESLFGTGG